VLRFVDRVGKGVRGAPRDALIADVVASAQRGTAYGWHRSMDHLGAVLGPLVAAALLTWAGLDLRWVFVSAVIPAVAVVVLIVVGVRDARAAPRTTETVSAIGGWGRFDWRYRRLLLAVTVFGLGNSTDAFLLLLLADSGIPTPWIAALWSAHHVVKVVATNVGGRLSDRVGRRPMLIAGWAIYGLVYLGFSALAGPVEMVALFLVYGVYFGLTEPVEKALVADLAPAELRGAAFGFFHAAVAVAALPASLLFGGLWAAFGRQAAFATGAVLAVVAAVILLGVSQHRRPEKMS
jgi:MFS family permease